MKTPVALSSEPADRTADLGPKHRGGPFALFVALFCAFSSAGTILLAWQEGLRGWAAGGALLFGGAAVWSAWCVLDRFRHHGALPRSHNVLAGTLAFEITSTCRDVAATVFFQPDRIQAGSSPQLCCFVENYASRRRVAWFRIGPHPGLGLREQHRVALDLAAGQAAVYLLPLSVARELAAEDHDLPVTLKVRKPNGTGVRLPGARRSLYDLWTIHFAVPFTVVAASAVPSTRESSSSAPQYLQLASVTEPEARLSVLATILEPSASRPS